MGAAQFIQAVGDMARGLTRPLVMPVWDREKFPDPKIKPSPLPELPMLSLDYVTVDFPMDYINKLKSQYMECTGKICSTFDILTAKLWQCRTRALDLQPESEVKLCFFASVRHLLKLDKGYYGNSIFPVKVISPSEKILKSTFMEVVNLIQDAKKRMALEFFKFTKEEIDTDPFQMTFNYESVYVSDWSKLGFVNVDYGFGKPMLCSPLVNNDFIASVVILKAPAPLEGARLLASCVTKEHSAEFIRGMTVME
jgi:Transferase family